MAGETSGFGDIQRNLEALEQRMLAARDNAADEIAALLEIYAKEHHGTTPRQAGWVYPGGGVRRWRESGIGWGDVTTNLQSSTAGGIAESTREFVLIFLTAGMDYAIWVELAREGRWSWLWPAITSNEKQIMRILVRHLRAAF